MTTQKEIRKAFWDLYYPYGIPKEYKGKRQNQLPANIRCAFVEFVDNIQRNGAISEALAFRVTL